MAAGGELTFESRDLSSGCNPRRCTRNDEPGPHSCIQPPAAASFAVDNACSDETPNQHSENS